MKGKRENVPLLLGADYAQRSEVLYSGNCMCFWSLTPRKKRKKKRGLIKLEGKQISGIGMF